MPAFQRFLFDYLSLDSAPEPPENVDLGRAVNLVPDNHVEFGYLIQNNAKLYYSFKGDIEYILS